MKYFILLAIIFFSWRVFSAEGYYYEGRYYNIDKYIRSQEDPNYQEFLNQKRVETQKRNAGVDQYFEQREKEAIAQEKSRKAYVAQLPNQTDADKRLLNQEAEYEKYLEKEQLRQSKLQAQYLFEKDAAMAKLQPKKQSRMIASTEFSEEEPLKRIPRDKRKFISKGREPKIFGKKK